MKYLPFVVVLVVLGIGTLIEGKFSDRWGQAKSNRLSDFTERLKLVPKKIGDWEGVDEKVNEEEFKASNCDGYISRTYRNRDGQRVNVYLVSGSARHVTIHTPDWCYVGAGYNMAMEPQQYTIENVEAGLPSAPEFLTTLFRKEDPISSHNIRIFWGFSDDGNWRGPRMPKPAFAGKSAMYKIYMITELDGRAVAGDIESNPTLDFARRFLPEIQPILFSDSPVDAAGVPAASAPAASSADLPPADADLPSADADLPSADADLPSADNKPAPAAEPLPDDELPGE